MKRKIFSDQSNFAEIRKADGLYVDKTKKIYDIMGHSGKYFFLSRPRRFGKSMLCSTLQALFAGQRELFKGLWIDSSDWEWKKHPVIHLNMGKIAEAGGNLATLTAKLQEMLQRCADEFDVSLVQSESVTNIFESLLNAMAKKYNTGVVVIIDEYDKPMLDLFLTEKHSKDVQALLKSFYGKLKHSEESLRFAFITGVYKFAKTSIFSDLNNLRDLTFDRKASDLVGYTQEEVETNFAPEITTLAQKEKAGSKMFLHKLREQCNGYVFGIDLSTGVLAPSVYNSFALNVIFASNEFKIDIWFGTGTPTFLIKQLATRNFEPIRIDNLEVPFSTLVNSCEPEQISAETLLYYAGYATIKSYDTDTKYVQLKMPNQEVACAMAGEILPRMGDEHQFNAMKRASLALRNVWRLSDFEAARLQLNICLGMLHNKLYTSSENYFQTVIMLFFQMADMHIEAELGTHLGYIDLVLWAKEAIYIIEIKMDKSVKLALEQIKTRKYYTGLLAEQKPIFLVGMNCSSKERAVTQLQVIPLAEQGL